MLLGSEKNCSELDLEFGNGLIVKVLGRYRLFIRGTTVGIIFGGQTVTSGGLADGDGSAVGRS